MYLYYKSLLLPVSNLIIYMITNQICTTSNCKHFLNEFWLNIFDHEEFCVLISIKVNVKKRGYVYLKKLEKRMHKETLEKIMHEEKSHKISTIVFQTNFIYTLKHYLQKQKREIELLSRALASLYKKNMKSQTYNSIL